MVAWGHGALGQRRWTAALAADGSQQWLAMGRHKGAEVEVRVWWHGQQRCARTAGVAASDSSCSDRVIITRLVIGNASHDSQSGRDTQQLRD
jgi:hypothetical protein